jgi:hypothetical protein
VHVLKTGYRWQDCPSCYGRATTIYNRFLYMQTGQGVPDGKNPRSDLSIRSSADGISPSRHRQGRRRIDSPRRNRLKEITRAAGAIGIPGLHETEDPGDKPRAAKQGNLSLRLGLGWTKSHVLNTDFRCPRR